MKFVAGSGVADTVDAVQPQALTVQAFDPAGKPLPSTVIRFTSGTAPSKIPYEPPKATVLLAKVTSAVFASFATDSTNASGIASVVLKMGTVAGPGMVIVSVPLYGLVDTARFTIRSGGAVRLTVAPHDTAIFIGANASLRASVLDRYGNLRTDAAVFSSSVSRVSVSGQVVSGAAFGRATVMARVGALSDSALISVVPRGTIAAQTALTSTGDLLAIWAFDLDGSNFRRIVTSAIPSGYFGEMPPVWSVDGKSIFYHDNKYDHTRSLWVVDVATGVQKRLIAPESQLADERWPARSADGQWIYFHGPSYGTSQIYRVRTNGTGVEAVGSGSTPQLHTHASPDGASVAYSRSSDWWYSSAGLLEIMNLATRAVTQVHLTVQRPVWSPSGAYIAYVDETGAGIWIVRPDGSGGRQLASTVTFDGGIDWSPDGKYLVGTIGSGTITVVDAETGEFAPVKITAVSTGFRAPSWKP